MTPDPEIRDIAPPVEIFPWPWWAVALAAVLSLLFVLFVVWLIARWLRRRPAPPSPTPREVALQQLQELRKRIAQTAPYQFSIAVSDVLRAFVTAQYHLPATQQTSPEFLESLRSFTRLSVDRKTLLGQFLEKCDLIKFARIDATASDSEALLAQAVSFVEGGTA